MRYIRSQFTWCVPILFVQNANIFIEFFISRLFDWIRFLKMSHRHGRIQLRRQATEGTACMTSNLLNIKKGRKSYHKFNDIIMQ